ncbi:hypothetical protein [Lederbergia citri]|uniref:Uncharacterized protein n=1 Tax=Lederbergia citri TaxID=2833580 RepID=A0A942YGX7_9BACI|nr:hypothetical protein [Lederbergia citri]MBS4195977.1 hypothetical protein [Lederbergia citri]
MEKSHTIREIEQQPSLWVKAIEQFSSEKEKIEQFLQAIKQSMNTLALFLQVLEQVLLLEKRFILIFAEKLEIGAGR